MKVPGVSYRSAFLKGMISLAEKQWFQVMSLTVVTSLLFQGSFAMDDVVQRIGQQKLTPRENLKQILDVEAPGTFRHQKYAEK